MSIGPYFTGQRPAEPLVITVSDSDGSAKDLSVYTAASLVLIDPSGNEVDLTGGATTIAANEVSFVWPAASVLDAPGDYKYQLRLSNTDYEDYTSIDHFEVYERLGD